MEENKEKPHCWGEFLRIRKDVINWMSEEKGRDDKEIAYTLSMDAKQVFLIRTYKPPEMLIPNQSAC